VLFASCCVGLASTRWILHIGETFFGPVPPDFDFLLSLLFFPSILLVCAFVLKITLGKDFAQPHASPVPLLDFVKAPVLVWVLVLWGHVLVHSGSEFTVASAILMAAPLYLLGSVVVSYGVRAWIASALTIVGLGWLQVLGRDETFLLAYVLVPPVSALAASIWGRHRSKLPIPGRCRGCGYNLTGNVSGVCPECGLATDAPDKECADRGRIDS
jgi:hypothetical protein